MKTRKIYRRPLWAALTVVASLFLALLITAPQVQANTGAGATILNTVGITYFDASGATTYNANASTFVTVNLVKAALTYSGRPTVAKPGATALLPAGQTVDSGTTPTYLIALTANANGGDTYNLSRAISSVTNMASDTVTYSTVRNDGSTVITSGSPATVALGASVIQANTANTISIPGGSTVAAAIQTNAAGFKVLVVNGVDYIVTGSITTGTAPANTHVGATYYNNTGAATAEALAVITLAANPSGANVAPAFTVNALKGTVAAEQILVLVSVNGVVGTTVGTDGTVAFTLTTTDSSSGNSATSTSITTTFKGSNLQVQKNVRNLGPTGVLNPAFAASATGNPGDILEYQVLVKNAGGSSAAKVSASDAVPIYTQLVCGGVGTLGTTACSGTPTTAAIATIYDGTTTTYITYQSSDNECLSPGVGAGNAAGFAEGSALNFYMGNTTTCNATTGGTVNAGATYTITYRVKMN